MIGFSSNDAALGNVELIPAGTLARAVISFDKEGFTKPNEEKGTAGGGHYKECKITVAEGPFAKRTIFYYLSNPEDPKNSDRAKDMGRAALVRMLEAAGVFDPTNPASYRAMTFEQACLEVARAQTMGRTIALEIGVQKGTNGYGDKNVVRTFLSPNPKSDSSAKWKRLLSGQTGSTTAAPMAPATGFMAAPAQQQPAQAAPQGFGQSAPGWLNPAQQQPAPMDDQIPF